MTPPGLEITARAIVANGKGILAADETPGTLTKRLSALGIESTPDTRRAYREMFFATPGVAEYISGVILQGETIRQRSSRGTPLADLLTEQGSSQASKSIRARNRSRASPASASPKDSTGYAAASRSSARWARASRSGAP
jgi:fructose-bisphosphate aldolase class I